MTTNSRIPVSSAAHLAALLAIAFSACGTTPLSSTGASPLGAGDPVTTVILQETLSGVEAGGERVLRLQLEQKGDLALTVRWDDPADSVVAFLLSDECTRVRFSPAECDARQSVGREGREGREQYIERGGASGAFWVRVRNDGPGAETIHVTAELTARVPATPTPDPPERERPNPRYSGRP